MSRHRRAVVGLAVLAMIAASAVREGTAQSEPLPTIMISRQLAEAEEVTVGDTLLLSSGPGGASRRQFRVVGLYEPTPDPMRLAASRWEARLHLPDLLDLIEDTSDPSAADAITAINVALTDPADASAFASDVSATIPMPGLIARTARGGEESAGVFVVLERFHLAIAVVTVIASTVFLLALMVMLVEERRETVGILRLIGLRKERLLLQVLAEGLLIAAVGALFGVLLAKALEGAVNVFFQWRYDTALVFVHITPRIALQCVMLAVPLGILAALASSWTLLRTGGLNLARR